MTPDEHEDALLHEVRRLVDGLAARTIPLRKQAARFTSRCHEVVGSPRRGPERLRGAVTVLKKLEAELHAWSSDGDRYGPQFARLFDIPVRMLALEASRRASKR